MVQETKNKAFITAFIFIVLIVVVTLSGWVNFSLDSKIASIPSAVCWVVLCNFAFLALSVLGYLFVFKPWAKDTDGDIE